MVCKIPGGDSSTAVDEKLGIALADLLRWNKAQTSACTTIGLDEAYCVAGGGAACSKIYTVSRLVSRVALWLILLLFFFRRWYQAIRVASSNQSSASHWLIFSPGTRSWIRAAPFKSGRISVFFEQRKRVQCACSGGGGERGMSVEV